MSANSFLPTEVEGQRRTSIIPAPRWIADWLPARRQIMEALQFQFERPLFDADGVSLTTDTVWTTSMRQGLGLIVLAGLVAGSLAFLVDWIFAARVGAALPLAEMSQWAARQADVGGEPVFPPALVFRETLRSIAGLPPSVFPGWLAAGVTALGAWLNVPLRWLQLWIVYGTFVFGVATAMGSRATLQRFFALTAYAVLPLLLTILGPIPCLGALATVVAAVWAIVLYWVAVRAVTGLSGAQAALCLLAPGALAVVAGILIAVTALVAGVGLLF